MEMNFCSVLSAQIGALHALLVGTVSENSLLDYSFNDPFLDGRDYLDRASLLDMISIRR